MNCQGCRQRFLPLPDLSRNIEGDSARRVLHLLYCYSMVKASLNSRKSASQSGDTIDCLQF